MTEPTFENTVRLLDKAIFDWLDGFTVNYGVVNGQERNQHPILRVFASPQRAFATVADLLVREGWVPGDSPELKKATAEAHWPTLPLPIITIERDDPIISNELANPSAQVTRLMYNPATGTSEMHEFPLHYLTQYRLTLWCDKQYTRAAFVEWLMNQLGRRGAWQDELFLNVEHPLPWGKQIHQLRYTGSANLSDLEGNDARHIRQMYSIILRSWMFRTPTKYDVVQSISNQSVISYDVKSDESGTDSSTFNDQPLWSSGNLYKPSVVPAVAYDGGIIVKSTDDNAATIKVSTEVSGVLLSRVATQPDPYGRSLFSIRFRSSSLKPFVAVFTEKVNGTARVSGVVDVPAGNSVLTHAFFACVGTDAGIGINGAGAETTVSLTDIQFVQLYYNERIPPSDAGTSLGYTAYCWRNLAQVPYMIVAYAEPSSANVSGTIRVYDSADMPNVFKEEPQAYPPRRGVALVSMPSDGTLQLELPEGLTYSSVFAFPYKGWWDGSAHLSEGTIEVLPAQVATPSIYGVDEGGVYIECATTGATIFYTLDGTVPTASSSVYSGVLTMADEVTHVRAIATKSGMVNSEQAYAIVIRSNRAIRMWGHTGAQQTTYTHIDGRILSFSKPAGSWSDYGHGVLAGLYSRTERRYVQLAGGVDRVLPDAPGDGWWMGSWGVGVISLSHDDVVIAAWDNYDGPFKVRRWVNGQLVSSSTIPIKDGVHAGTGAVKLAYANGRLLVMYSQRTPDDQVQWASLAHSDDLGATWTVDREDNSAGGGSNYYRHSIDLFWHQNRFWSFVTQRGLGNAAVLISEDGVTWAEHASPHSYQWRACMVPTEYGVAVVQGTVSWNNAFAMNVDGQITYLSGNNFSGSTIAYHDGDLYSEPANSTGFRINRESATVDSGVTTPSSASGDYVLLSIPVLVPT